MKTLKSASEEERGFQGSPQDDGWPRMLDEQVHL